MPMGFEMLFAAARPVEDHSELASRRQSAQIGSLLTLATTAAGAWYALATWGAPQRPAVVVLLAIAAAWAVVPLALGADRIVRSARREGFFLAWSAGTVALSGGLVAADGGARSPLALLFLLPIVFGALSYPLRSLVAICAFDLSTYVGVGLGTESASGPHIAFVVTCFSITALLCAWQARDQDRRRAALAEISRADPLTGCLNRRGFEERLEAEFDSARRSGGRFGLVVVDLDDFKDVNDTRGHAAGDDLLRWSVRRLGDVLRPMDSLGRLGGDEFAIAIPGAGPLEAAEVAARVRAALADRVSVSAGVASFPVDAIDRDALHRQADAHLYAVKHGRSSSTRGATFATTLAQAVTLRMTVPGEETSAVPHYAAAIASRLGFSEPDFAMLRLAAILHDIGKVAVPDAILRKRGMLTADEYEQMKSHPGAGAEIVSRMDGLGPAAEWIRHSHEHVDGSGYPSGLAGEEIPLASRVLLVADAYDSMTGNRAYGAPLPPEVALAELQLGTGYHFDAACVDALAGYLADHPDAVRERAFVAKRFVRSSSAITA